MNFISISSRLNPEFIIGALNPVSARFMSIRIQDNIDKKASSRHVYRDLYPWRSKDQLATELMSRIVYNEGHVIALNKPYGVGVKKPIISEEKTNRKMNLSGHGECEFYVEDTLPLLQSRLGLKSPIQIVKSTERYSSGLTILSSEKSTADKISKSLRRGKTAGVSLYTYQTVVTNIPVANKSATEKVGIQLENIPELKQKAPVIVKGYSKSAVKRNEVNVAKVEMRVLSVNNTYNVALVELSTTTSIWHFVRVYLAYRLAPVLGDVMYSARVKMVMGKAIAISPHNSACYSPALLSERVCNQLRVPKDNVLIIPAHIHLHKVTLTGFLGGKDLVLTASHNDRFLWTAEQLKILPEVETQALLQQTN